MLLQRSRLDAATAERPRLAPPWSIVLLCGLVSLGLIAIFPHRDLVQRVYEAPPSLITEAYLTNLLRTDPGNPRLRLMLARSQLQIGEHQRVGQTVAPALQSDDAALRREAAWLLWLAGEQRLGKLDKAGAAYHAQRAELAQRLAALAREDWPEDQLAVIARKALLLGDTTLGLALFERLAAAGEGQRNPWFQEAAREALAYGEYRAAAEFYLLAARRAATPDDQRRLFVDALRALQSGDRLPEALQLAEGELAVQPHLADGREVLILLVEFARAARRPDLADRYARRLLRLSLLEQWRRMEFARTHFGASVRRVALENEELRDGPKLAFDERAYTLGFEAFLDNRKLDDAWKVAASAVRQAPASLVWRERLAKVSEWSGRPRLGLENWLHLARATGREDAWQAVLRLAPGLFDDEALRLALQRELARRPGDPALVGELAELHERLGDPAGALAFLERQYATLRQAWLVERMAEVAERAGDDAQAVAYWRRYAALQAPTPAQAVRMAVLLILRDGGEEALAVLRRSAAQAAPEDQVFWRLTGELARQQDEDAAATDAYRKLIATGQARENDYDVLYALLEVDHPLDAARVAVAAWRKFERLNDLTRALGRWAVAGAWQQTGQLLAELNAAQLRRLRRQPELLRLTAQYHLHGGAHAEARRDIEAALALAPEDVETQQAYLWVMIEAGDGVALRRALAGGEIEWARDSRLHDALGAAYQYLSRPDVALKRYFTPRLAGKRDDFLWLMNYADALETNGEVDRAWRLRQQLLAGERQRAGRRDWLTAPEAVEMRRIARARLAISQRQGDTGLAVLRELLRLDRDGQGRLSENAAVVATAWLQEQQAYQAERGWIWQRFARTTSRPLWGEITVALVEDDRPWIGALLDRHGERLPRYDRINAARRIDDVRLAQTDAFETQADQPDDDPLHLQLSDALLAHGDHAALDVANRQVGTLDEHERGGRWHLALTPRLTLDLSLGSIARDNRDTAVIGVVPGQHYRKARLSWRHADGETRFGAEAHQSFAAFQPLYLEHEQRLDERLRASFALGRELPTAESLALRVAGMRSRAAAGLNYRASLRDQFVVEQAWERYRTQTGTAVGSGRHFLIDYRHAVRIERRDLEASAFWSSHRYKREGVIDDAALLPLQPAGSSASVFEGSYFLPENFRYYGLRLSTDVRFAEQYSRAWRPYASVARTWNSTSGNGYDLGAGIAGNVFGADHLRLGWSLVRGGQNSGGLVRQFELGYRLHY